MQGRFKDKRWRAILKAAGVSPKGNWIKNLKVGDVVCDCRYLHLEIKEITFERPSNIRGRRHYPKDFKRLPWTLP